MEEDLPPAVLGMQPPTALPKDALFKLSPLLHQLLLVRPPHSSYDKLLELKDLVSQYVESSQSPQQLSRDQSLIMEVDSKALSYDLEPCVVSSGRRNSRTCSETSSEEDPSSSFMEDDDNSIEANCKSPPIPPLSLFSLAVAQQQQDASESQTEGLDAWTDRQWDIVCRQEEQLTLLQDGLGKISESVSAYQGAVQSCQAINLNIQPDVLSLASQIDKLSEILSNSLNFCRLFKTSNSTCTNSSLGFFGFLPPELQMKIFSFLDAYSLTQAAQVCSTWKQACMDDLMWMALCERNWPGSTKYGRPACRTWKWFYRCRSYTFASQERRDGLGSFKLQNGTFYSGEWADNLRNGWGVSVMSNGRVYVGCWSHDKRNGLGTFCWPGGSNRLGGDIYIGEWKDSKRNGVGAYIWADGRVYIGRWNEDKRNGGTSSYPDGHKYDGEYKDGKREGSGSCTYPTGARYIGEYRNNKREGLGTYYWQDGDCFIGRWKRGRRVGKGTFYSKQMGKWIAQEWNELDVFEEGNKGVPDDSLPTL